MKPLVQVPESVKQLQALNNDAFINRNRLILCEGLLELLFNRQRIYDSNPLTMETLYYKSIHGRVWYMDGKCERQLTKNPEKSIMIPCTFTGEFRLDYINADDYDHNTLLEITSIIKGLTNFEKKMLKAHFYYIAVKSPLIRKYDAEEKKFIRSSKFITTKVFKYIRDIKRGKHCSCKWCSEAVAEELRHVFLGFKRGYEMNICPKIKNRNFSICYDCVLNVVSDYKRIKYIKDNNIMCLSRYHFDRKFKEVARYI